MRSDKLVPGTILVIIGLMIMLDNFNVIDFSWSAFFSLWPILLIIAGVNLVFAHNRSNWAIAIKMGVLVVGMGFLIFGSRTNGAPGWMHSYRGMFDDEHYDRDTTSDVADQMPGTDSVVQYKGKTIYRKAFTPGTQYAELNISGGATTYSLRGTTKDLFEAATKQTNVGYDLSTHIDSATQVLDFDMAGGDHHVVFNFGKSDNRVDMRLNPAPIWDIDIQSGASGAKFDLSQYKVRKLNIQGGVASYKFKLGQPLVSTDVDINTGVSSVTLSIPRNAACRITTDTGLSSKSFSGFSKKDDDTYETEGYQTATNKMNITIEGGVSDFKVVRY